MNAYQYNPAFWASSQQAYQPYSDYPQQNYPYNYDRKFNYNQDSSTNYASNYWPRHAFNNFSTSGPRRLNLAYVLYNSFYIFTDQANHHQHWVLNGLQQNQMSYNSYYNSFPTGPVSPDATSDRTTGSISPTASSSTESHFSYPEDQPEQVYGHFLQPPMSKILSSSSPSTSPHSFSLGTNFVDVNKSKTEAAAESAPLPQGVRKGNDVI